jgi:hypothetical protein
MGKYREIGSDNIHELVDFGFPQQIYREIQMHKANEDFRN